MNLENKNNLKDKNNFLDDFGNWITSQNPFNTSSFNKVNQKVYPKSVKFCNKISLDIGNFLEVKKDFLKNGGRVIKEDNEMILVEVKSGTFYIKKDYIY